MLREISCLILSRSVSAEEGFGAIARGPAGGEAELWSAETDGMNMGVWYCACIGVRCICGYSDNILIRLARGRLVVWCTAHACSHVAGALSDRPSESCSPPIAQP